MKTIIAGSRTLNDFEQVKRAIAESGFEITEVVSGACRTGVDPLGEKWGFLNDVPIKRFPADWNSKAGKGAGHIRNRTMAEYAEALVACWDGKSKGTENMIKEAKKKGLKVFVFNDSL